MSVVERDPHGLSVEEQRRAVGQALAIDRPSDGSDPPFVVLPVTNTAGAVPGSRESSTAVISYFEFPPAMSLSGRMEAVGRYMADARRAGAPVVGRTGILPAQLHEGTIVEDALPYVEAATILMVALIVGLKFRSFGAPAMTLGTVGIAYLMALRATERLSEATGVAVPDILKPLMVALVLGIVTDYTIFYASTMQSLLTQWCRARARRPADDRPDHADRRRRRGDPRGQPRVAAGGAAQLLPRGRPRAGRVGARGPRRRRSRSCRPRWRCSGGRSTGRACRPRPTLRSSRRAGTCDRGSPISRRGVHSASSSRRRAWRCSRRPRGSCPTCGVGFTSVHGLPADAQERRAAEAVSRAFAPGMLAPTEVLVEGVGSDDGLALIRLQAAIRRQPGVAAVAGPAQQLGRTDVTAFRQGDAARYIVAFDSDPHGATAIGDVNRLRERLPGLARSAGLDGARVSVTGDTALADDTISAMGSDLIRVAVVVLLVNLVMLALYLRALVAPVLLVLASVLSVAAAMGITVWVFQTFLGYGELTYYVPFAAAVLLVSLGSDYNVFIAGRVWQEARGRPVREALAEAAPQAAGAIRTAGITLALSFALLAIIHVRAFWEFAFAMAIGILIETFVVRPLLVPALVALFGEAAGWPGNRLRSPEPAPANGD